MQQENVDSVQNNTTIPQFRLRNEAIKAAIDFKKENDPAFKDISLDKLADKCRVGVSTFKRILSGATLDANCSTIALICEGLGIDPAVVMGLAPARDYDREKETYNPTLMDTLRRQNVALEERLEEKRSRINELTAEVSAKEADCNRVRRMYNEKCIELSAAVTRMESMKADAGKDANHNAHRDETEKRLQKDVDELKTTLYSERAEARKVRMLGALACIGLVAALGIIVYLLWEMANPNIGRFRY